MKRKCKQNTDVCCHCKKDVNNLSKQDQEMLEEFRDEFPSEVITFEDGMARIETKLVTMERLQSFLLKHTARAREEGYQEGFKHGSTHTIRKVRSKLRTLMVKSSEDLKSRFNSQPLPKFMIFNTALKIAITNLTNDSYSTEEEA